MEWSKDDYLSYGKKEDTKKYKDIVEHAPNSFQIKWSVFNTRTLKMHDHTYDYENGRCDAVFFLNLCSRIQKESTFKVRVKANP